jgi:hypothetical protein
MKAHRRFGWLVTALSDRGHMQKDLAKAWGTDDAVVTRFISTGKPDLTPERQIALARMLGMDHNELIARMYEGVAPRAVKEQDGEKSRQPVPAKPGIAPRSGDVNQTLADIQRGIKLLREMLPSAKIHFSIDVAGEDNGL